MEKLLTQLARGPLPGDIVSDEKMLLELLRERKIWITAPPAINGQWLLQYLGRELIDLKTLCQRVGGFDPEQVAALLDELVKQGKVEKLSLELGDDHLEMREMAVYRRSGRRAPLNLSRDRQRILDLLSSTPRTAEEISKLMFGPTARKKQANPHLYELERMGLARMTRGPGAAPLWSR